MANNYLQFSEVLTQLNSEEEKWLKDQFQLVAVHDGQETEIEDEGDKAVSCAEWTGPRFLRDKDDYDQGCDRLGFQFQFNDDDGWGRYLWVYSDESGDPDNVSWLVRKFLKQFRVDQCWSLTWAEMCSKLRVGEFSGGGVFVTAEEIKWASAGAFIEQERAAFQAGKVTTKPKCPKPAPKLRKPRKRRIPKAPNHA
jgi:hypothetical protein